MIIGFTGTRQGMTPKQQTFLRDLLSANHGEFHHGDCLGADHQAHDLAKMYGWEIWVHPPDIPTNRAFCCEGATVILEEQSYRIRNQQIVNQSELLVAMPHFPEDDSHSKRSGSWMTVRMARKRSMPLIIVYPDGKILTWESR